MTCGYRNPAGTDLDDLFYSDYQNSGAIGFRQPDGWDLGNKYTSLSTLGYSLGYRNAAGTDIGYLRGNMYVPTINTGACSISVSDGGKSYVHPPRVESTGGDDDHEVYSYDSESWLIKGIITVNLSTNWPGAQTIEGEYRYVNNHPNDRQWLTIAFRNSDQIFENPIVVPKTVGSSHQGTVIVGWEGIRKYYLANEGANDGKGRLWTDASREGYAVDLLTGDEVNMSISDRFTDTVIIRDSGRTTYPCPMCSIRIENSGTPLKISFALHQMAYNNGRFRQPCQFTSQMRFRSSNEAGTGQWTDWIETTLFSFS